ncbi:sensor histidine kinase [Cohnella soli]|uniref:histidine kinase n=1 Tax=Cohnella soli TaxID=425005 RepID=A0ABW0I1M0_9BACL
MPIRRRMLLSYTLMMLASVLCIVGLGLTVAIAITGDWTGVRDLFDRQYALKPVTAQEQDAFDEARYYAKKTPDSMLDTKLLATLDDKLPSVKAGLIVRKGEQAIYATPSLGLKLDDIRLPPYEMVNINVRGTWANDGQKHSYVKFDFRYSDGDSGSLYIVKKISPYGEMTSRWFPVLIGLLLLLPFVVNGLLNYFMTRSIVNPLKELKLAADRIREGELGFEVLTRSQDEIGELFRSFEDMRRRLEESVQVRLQDEENRKELLANISHDLKTPITTIKGYVEGIRDGVAGTPDKLDRYLSTIYAKAIGMDKLIDELFLFSKLDMGKVPFHFEKADIGRYAADWAEELALDCAGKGIAVEYEDELPETTFVKLDREKLKRALFNITDNSAKYADKQNKQIVIRLSAHGDEALIAITDNGPGIKPEALPHLFERFYRAENSRNSGTGGSGLGLAIAKQIAEEHGGNIAASSVPGEGTKVTIALKKWSGDRGNER